MKKCLLFIFIITNVNAFADPTPYICFTDLTSGPATGNSDNSQTGQVAGQDGVIVTLWGKNLGSSQAGSQVLVGGQVARIYGWGNATSPAELHSTLGLQMVAFQIPGSLSTGVTNIRVVVQGITSNTLPFTVRSGNVFFLKTTGNDNTGNGSWSNPWATLDNAGNTGALDKISPGDIVYLCDGISHTVLAGDRATIDLGSPGTESAPKAIIGYPGAIASIGNPSIEKSYALWVSGFGPTINWVIAKLQLVAQSEAASMYHQFRLVGNKITAPNGDGPSGAVTGQGNHLYMLGNELTNIGFIGTSKLYHPIYFQSAESCSGPRLPTESDREIAWNNMHDNLAFDGINIYRECVSSAYMTNHRVHDNYILNQTGCGIRIGDYVVGENWFYNNVVVNAGLGPDPPTEQAMHVPVYIHAGWEDTTTLIHFYNNTVYGGGFTGGAAWASSMVGFAFNHPLAIDFRNNIVVSTIAGVDYLNPALAIPPGGVEKNIWYGAGAAPVWDINPLNLDPSFKDVARNDFHLLDGSPALNSAMPLTPTALQPLPPYDFDAVVRPQNSIADIGAFEFVTFAALPVTWLSVNVKRINESKAVIDWQVGNQQNVKSYTVQVSTDGISFSDACNIVADNSTSYSCTASAASGRSYYFRVLQYDNDRRYSISNTVMLREEMPLLRFTLSPNPASHFTILNYHLPAGENITADLYDCNGVFISRQRFLSNTSGTVTIPLEKLSAGLYSLNIHYRGGKQVIKLIKQQ
jgi:hypothetical protein